MSSKERFSKYSSSMVKPRSKFYLICSIQFTFLRLLIRKFEKGTERQEKCLYIYIYIHTDVYSINSITELKHLRINTELFSVFMKIEEISLKPKCMKMTSLLYFL